MSSFWEKIKFLTFPKKKCVVLAVTSDYMFAAANVIIGMQRFNSGLIDKYIIFEDLEDPVARSDKESIARMFPGLIEFRIYKPTVKLQKVFGNSLFKRYSKMLFCKFEIFNLLKEYYSVLYLDADLLIQGDISEIFTSYKTLAWRSTVIPMKDRLGDVCFSHWKGIGKTNTAPNAGVIYVDRNFPAYATATMSCFKLLEELYPLTDQECLDEFVFGLLAYSNGINAQELPGKFNCGSGWFNSEDAVIIHSIGKHKFWNDIIRKKLYPEWSVNHKIWLKHGGRDYKGGVRLKKELGETNRDVLLSVGNWLFWQKFLFTNLSNLPNQIDSISCLTKAGVQLGFRKMMKGLHYELIHRSGNIVVALHIDKSFYSNESVLVEKLETVLLINGFRKKYLTNEISYESSVQKESTFGELKKLVGFNFEYTC